MTSAPKREMSCRDVIEVAISTKQHDSPKNIGHMEFARPQFTRSSSLAKNSDSASAFGIESGCSIVTRLGWTSIVNGTSGGGFLLGDFGIAMGS